MAMVEINWHGRGGQGVITASELIAEAALPEGKYVQANPEFGPERMGAPVRAFTRISDEKIDIHSNIYEPDIVVVLDPTLLGQVNITEGLQEDGVLIVNTSKSKDEIRKLTGFGGEVHTLDATKIALENIGRPIVNTSCSGALIKITGLVSLENLKDKIRKKFEKKLSSKALEGNLKAVDEAYAEVE
ncbi:pyruvate synthase [candidate division MSBL1 archaeon SCGC-AAA261F19]|uniref:pyruvate synthase n=2 Tax=candidate division MSBL1 TaxID=215777 RepID=A0A133VA53_9EURY|nr:pyruvate synthase [candidate division MSBL1 archaeon SCGC-AAA261D19]KXB03319.1 pyruvate synthase [candidate division MSBL1 archaeon SCGC-AAA261F19]